MKNVIKLKFFSLGYYTIASAAFIQGEQRNWSEKNLNAASKRKEYGAKSNFVKNLFVKLTAKFIFFGRWRGAHTKRGRGR